MTMNGPFQTVAKPHDRPRQSTHWTQPTCITALGLQRDYREI